MKNLADSPRRHRAAAFITCAAVIIALITFLFFSLKSEDFDTDPVYASVFRLHIRANSDSAEDQSTKYAVRDALLPSTAELFCDCEGMEDAANVALEREDEITSHINSTLSALGADYTCSLRVGKEEFPERNYGGEIYPAGEYTALIVELGEGEGENWWCVLFPSLCLSAVKVDDSVEAGLTADQIGVITAPADSAPATAPTYRLRFRFLELIEEIFDK